MLSTLQDRGNIENFVWYLTKTMVKYATTRFCKPKCSRTFVRRQHIDNFQYVVFQLNISTDISYLQKDTNKISSKCYDKNICYMNYQEMSLHLSINIHMK